MCLLRSNRRVRFYRRRQRFRKIHIDSSDHEGTGAYRRHDHCKRAEFKTDETSEHCKIQKRHRGCLSGFPSVEEWNIYENIAFALRVTETPTRVIKRKVPAALSLVGLAQKYKAFPKELSGGEQQRVAIARAIVNEPAILLADEPTGNLDPTNSWEIMSLLKEANDRGTTVLVVTHNQEIVNEMNERVITMKQGVIVSDEQKGGYIDED